MHQSAKATQRVTASECSAIFKVNSCFPQLALSRNTTNTGSKHIANNCNSDDVVLRLQVASHARRKESLKSCGRNDVTFERHFEYKLYAPECGHHRVTDLRRSVTRQGAGPVNAKKTRCSEQRTAAAAWQLREARAVYPWCRSQE